MKKHNYRMVSVCNCRFVQCFLAATTLREWRLYKCTFSDYLAISAMILPENLRSENSDQLRNQLPPPLLFRATRSAPASQQSPVVSIRLHMHTRMYVRIRKRTCARNGSHFFYSKVFQSYKAPQKGGLIHKTQGFDSSVSDADAQMK